jgi:hypothetical protein
MLVKLSKGGEGKKDRDQPITLKKLIEMSALKNRSRKDTKLESEEAEFRRRRGSGQPKWDSRCAMSILH